MGMNKPMLETVLASLAEHKGQWREIARQMEPQASDSYYSWLTKLTQGTIKDPSVNKIQRLHDFFICRGDMSGEATAVVVKADPYTGPERRHDIEPGHLMPKQRHSNHKKAA